MNKTLEIVARGFIKDYLNRCTESQILMFKRMYSPDNLDLPINDVVDRMDSSKLNHAMTQCENTLNIHQ